MPHWLPCRKHEDTVRQRGAETIDGVPTETNQGVSSKHFNSMSHNLRTAQLQTLYEPEEK
jgi:hypothetical protein